MAVKLKITIQYNNAIVSPDIHIEDTISMQQLASQRE
jgi:hypothetical protein